MRLFPRPLLVVLFALLVLPVSTSAAAPAFYRGFAVTASQPAGEMGNVTLDSLTLSARKKIRLEASFREAIADHGGIENTFAPRDPQNTNIVYLGTNHFIKDEGGQTGIFTVWSYNVSSNVGKRLASMRYTPADAPAGYGIVGNEGTTLVILKNIDGPYCPQQLTNTAITHATFQSLNLRNPKAGFRAYTPSASMKNVFEKLPRCGSATGGDDVDHTNDLNADDITLNTYPASIWHFPSMPLTVTVDAAKFPTGGTITIGEQAASAAGGQTFQVCSQAVCTATISPTVGMRHYIALVKDRSGKILAWKNWPMITVTSEPPPQI